MIEVDWVRDDQISELAALLVLYRGSERISFVIEWSGIVLSDDAPSAEIEEFASKWMELALANGLQFVTSDDLLPNDE